MNLGTILQGMGRGIPGHSWLSNSFLGDVITGGAGRAIERNQWHFPVGHDTSSFDDLAGAGASRTHGGRNTARGVGALFGAGALYSLLGGGGSGAGAVGEVGGGGGGGSVGSGGLEGGGIGEAAGEGATDASGPSWQDYLRQFGPRAANALSGMGGQQPYMPPVDNSMILPVPPEPSYSDLPPGLMTMLLAHAFQRQQQPDQPEERPILKSEGIA